MEMNKYEQTYSDLYKHTTFVFGNVWYGMASAIIMAIWLIWG